MNTYYNLCGDEIPFDLSPNSTSRTKAVTTIVLHSTCSGLDPAKSFHSAVNWLQSPKAKASAHFVISRKCVVVQLVDTDRQAWHAGKSQLDGRVGVNGFSVGIEIDHMDGEEDWPILQVQAAADLCRQLAEAYGLDLQNDETIVSHEQIATPAGRKTDPMDFPWDRFNQFLGR